LTSVENFLGKKRTGLIGSSVINRYPAYAIVGNVIIMCEAEVDDCLELVQLIID